MVTIRTVRVDQSTPQEIEAILEQDGCIVVTGLLSQKRVEKLKQEMDTSFAALSTCQGNFFGFSTKRFSSVLARSEVAREIAMNPLILKIMDYFLLKSCQQYQINLTQAIQILPGEPAQLIHRDDTMFPCEIKNNNEKMINCMWAVDNFTATNGATNLVPQSHKWQRGSKGNDLPKQEQIVQGEMPAGSVLIYFGSLMHGGGANKADTSRTGLVISYCLGWLRQAENHYLALPKELVSSLPQRLQQLVGYFVHAPNLGTLDGHDPIEYIQDKMAGKYMFKEFIAEEFHDMLAEHRRRSLGQKTG